MDAIDDEITSELNRKKERVGSCSAGDTTNTRPKPESFDDVFPKQLLVVYENRMVSIE